jgi:hypothetical protein
MCFLKGEASIMKRLGSKSIEFIRGRLFMGSWIAGMRRLLARPAVLLAFWFTAAGYGQQFSVLERTSPLSATVLTADRSGPALAFGRYLASIQKRNPFTESGPVEVQIEASLPGLAKQGSMRAVRQTSASERSEYSEIQFAGDSTVKHEVIGRYLSAEEQAEDLPYASVAVTPSNYKFRYTGSVESNGTKVYVFQIAPRKKRAGLIQGQIGIDSATGVAVHQAGRFVKRPSVFIRRVEVARDTNLRDGLPATRVTHVAVETRLVGRAELTITERPLQTADREAAQLLISQRDER